MKCPKCGHELGEGNLYCEKCGEEVQYVPDFEPEIENSILDVMNDVAEQISPEGRNDSPRRERDPIEEFEPEPEVPDKTKDVVVIRKRTFFITIAIAALLVISCVGLICFFMFRDNSYDYQMSCAQKALASSDYALAIDHYEKAFSLNRDNTEPLFEIGKVYELSQNLPKAEEIYGKIISYSNDQKAIDKLIQIYISEKKYNDINAVLMTYADEDMQLKYIDYMAKPPAFSLEEGTYDEVMQLELIPSIEGSIYYTLDGSEPGSDCLLYTEPIVLRNGTYKVNAVFVNGNGICSQIVGRTYVIDTDVPDDPIVMPPDGTYSVPQLITLAVPPGVNVYYTTDDSRPTTMSAIYTDPIAIPLGDSVYHFIAVSASGTESNEIICRYTLDVDTRVSQETAIDIVAQRQFEIGRVESIDGSVPGSEGKYMYAYSELRYVQNRTLYFISEYYQEGTIRMSTGNIFAVDVYDGHLYQAVAGSNNTYTLRDF